MVICKFVQYPKVLLATDHVAYITARIFHVSYQVTTVMLKYTLNRTDLDKQLRFFDKVLTLES